MNSILIDNWTIEKAISNSKTQEIKSAELKRIMCFMILWDNVYYLDNGYSSWWQDCVDQDEELYVLLKMKQLPINDEYKSTVQQVYEQRFMNTEIPTIAQGAIEYLVNAELNNVHYAPVDERAAFIQKHNLIEDLFTRNDIIESIDSELLKYYEESSEKIRAADISLVTEALLSLIDGDSTKDISERIERLKRKPMIRRFRNWADRFETEIKEGKFLLIDDYLKELKDIEHMTIDAEVKSSTENSWFPMITFELQIPLLKMIKAWQPQFMFPSYMYKRGKDNAKNIVFPTKSIVERILH